jgi:hypothetical protein
LVRCLNYRQFLRSKYHFKFGARRRTRLRIPRPFTGIIWSNWRFVRLGVRRRRWLLPPFVRTSIPDPVKRNRFEVALCVFNLYFPVLGLRGTILLLSNHTKFRGVRIMTRYPAIRGYRRKKLDGSINAQLRKRTLFLFGSLTRCQHHQHGASF